MYLKFINNEKIRESDYMLSFIFSLFMNFFSEKRNTKIMKKKEIAKEIMIGVIAGIISGLFSTGGGLILVPAFSYFLNLDAVKARATSIMCILPMVITTSFFYAKNNYIDWKISILCAIGGMIGSYVGSKVLNKIPNVILKISFAIFLIYVALKMIGMI